MSIDKFSLPNLILLAASVVVLCYLYYVWTIIRDNASPAQMNSVSKKPKWFAIAYGLYLIIIFALGSTGFFATVTMPPRLAIIFIPIMATVILLVVSKISTSLNFLTLVPPATLVSIQAFRIAIEFGLTQFYADKIIPVELTFHGRNFDIAIGLLAIPIAYLLFTKQKLSTKLGIAFNILGLISFINITSIAVSSFPSPFRIYDTNYLPTYFPGILITFLAPVACYFHVLSLKQLMYRSRIG
jgi:hypothetical protein